MPKYRLVLVFINGSYYANIGIPQDDIEKIFDEFYRAPNAREIERERTGLGLSITKEIVERHQGRIWAQNNPTAGCTFSFTLVKNP